MSLLSQKQRRKVEEKKRFGAKSKRTAFSAVILLLLIVAVIALVALVLFYVLNCPPNRDAMAERSRAVESYSLSSSPAGGCAGPPTPLFSDTSDSAHSVLYLLGEGEIKPWQAVGDSPINLYFHQGGILKIHVLDSNGNFTTKTLGDVKVKGDASLMVTLPASHWHAWEPENRYPIILFSVVTASGSPDFTQHPLADISADPVLTSFANNTDMDAMIMKFSTAPTSAYCMESS